jgi:hypothetical protein
MNNNSDVSKALANLIDSVMVAPMGDQGDGWVVWTNDSDEVEIYNPNGILAAKVSLSTETVTIL